MSTSPKPAPVPESSPSAAFEPFPYDSIPVGFQRVAKVDNLAPAGDAASEQASRELKARLEGRAEGQAEARKQFEQQLVAERATLCEALAGFTRDRAAYFAKVEAEVVELALSIARKILHREAQVDPLLLAGIVRVALEKIDGATGVVLRIHPQNTADWRRYLSMHLDPDDLPEMVEDPAQAVDRCVLETSMGTAVIGLEVQLKEIEQGLMDLMAARPKAAAAGAAG